MRILRIRRGFQADHSSSSYLFYAVDHEVSEKGQAIAHRFSSRAEVDERSARYLKWGESSLSPDAYKALLDEHYDVMTEESYDWWTLMIAVPKTPQMRAVLAPFADARGYNDQGVDVVEYPKRLVVTIYCQFEGSGVNFVDDYDGDPHESLVDLLAKIRAELIEGNTSFLQAVAEFYDGLEEDEEDEGESGDDRDTASSPASFQDMSKAELQRECEARGITFRKSWTKAQLQEALATSRQNPTKGKRKEGKPKGRQPKLSRAAQTIVGELERV
jgi:hypothetical protein